LAPHNQLSWLETYRTTIENYDMGEPQIELDENPSIDDFRIVLDGVRKFNREQTGNERPRAVACFLRDEGRIVGGVQGSLWGRSMHIDALWVDEQFRDGGYGSKLMTAVEEYAAAHHHPLVYLETTSFQALPFYRKLGYEVFGELSEISDGHTLFFLRKEV
jgi:ribosomal protein S18 acetylase RimI-like enzyme